MKSFCQRCLLGFCLIFMASPLTLCPVVLANPLAQENLQKGDEFYRAHDNQKALEFYLQAFTIDPSEYEALMRVARAYNDIGEDLDNTQSQAYYEKAVKYAEILRNEFPDKAESCYLLSAAYGNLALFRGGKEKVKLSRQVESNAKRAIELDPDYALPYMVLGVYYREVANLNWLLKTFAKTFFGAKLEGTNQDSENMFLKALQLKPDSVFANFEIGQTYEKMNNANKAVEYYRKAVALPLTDHNDKNKARQAQLRLKQLSQP